MMYTFGSMLDLLTTATLLQVNLKGKDYKKYIKIKVNVPSNCIASLVTVDFLYNKGDCVKAKIPLADTCFFTLGP